MQILNKKYENKLMAFTMDEINPTCHFYYLKFEQPSNDEQFNEIQEANSQQTVSLEFQEINIIKRCMQKSDIYWN